MQIAWLSSPSLRRDRALIEFPLFPLEIIGNSDVGSFEILHKRPYKLFIPVMAKFDNNWSWFR